VRLVKDPDGETLTSERAEPQQTIRPAIAYLITSLMQSVVEDGTAQKVKVLGRPLAGKTGTTNEARNAWFIGFSPDLVTAVWVGFDNNDPLGPYETGGRAAIPIWTEVMRSAFARSATRDFAAPSGVVFAVVDPESGKLVAPDAEGSRTEPFLEGTQPTEFREDGAPEDRMIWEDYER
jgi:penicillin-binding protein 1A